MSPPAQGRASMRRHRRGFALLEAIVALTLLAGVGMALFAWIQQNLTDASRLRQRELEARLLISAQSLVQTIEPIGRTDGTLDAGDLRLSWQAEIVEPERRNKPFGDEAVGPFRVGLYRLDVRARDLRNSVEVNFVQWQVGARRDGTPERTQ